LSRTPGTWRIQKEAEVATFERRKSRRWTHLHLKIQVPGVKFDRCIYVIGYVPNADFIHIVTFHI
jgi:hypothetical protein